ncbi:MAG: NTP transferase domain-containing protein [Syntrophomonadaceae bacterium]|jgi:GTP:adenosylcobinamide-phosphate guanylyltransferase|nr:NTP transferase domain-containing protein [Syntrophomonadaceae bacterium]
MQYDAIILAGGETSELLKPVSPYNNESLIIIGQYPIIYYVYQALKASSHINNIVVSGPVEALRNVLGNDDRLFFAESGEDAIDSMQNALNMLKEMSLTDKILILPSDIPFITTEAIDDFITRCEDYSADFYYPIIRQEVNENKYPGVKRTYIKIKEGSFTGGNLFIINHKIIAKAVSKAKLIIQQRKNPLAIIRMFGAAIFIRYLFKQLTLPYAEKTFRRIIGISGKAIISPFAEVGVDVDKPSDLELAQQHLSDTVF